MPIIEPAWRGDYAASRPSISTGEQDARVHRAPRRRPRGREARGEDAGSTERTVASGAGAEGNADRRGTGTADGITGADRRPNPTMTDPLSLARLRHGLRRRTALRALAVRDAADAGLPLLDLRHLGRRDEGEGDAETRARPRRRRSAAACSSAARASWRASRRSSSCSAPRRPSSAASLQTWQVELFGVPITRSPGGGRS